MQHAVIVAHGQPSNPEPAEQSLAEYAKQVDALTDQVSVHSATLALPGALERCLDQLPDGTAIYPLFMARGWFVTSVLPKRIGARPVPILDPLGTDPLLPKLVANALQEILSHRNWPAPRTDLVVAAHGSGRSANPAAVAQAFTTELARLISFNQVRLGFVEQEPSISEAATGLGDQSVCLPLFACRGGHVQEDVPEELRRAAFSGYVTPVIGELSGVQQHIAAQLEANLAS